MSSFHEVRFPTDIARGASGGPERLTEIVTLGSGHEERNTRWAHSKRRYNAGFGVKSLDDIHQVTSFFEERRGRLYGFRWKDHTDFKSAAPQVEITFLDQQIGVGDGSEQTFKLTKSYGDGDNKYIRPINKPVDGTVIVALDGAAETNFTFDATTGEVTFNVPPAAGVVITAGFEFDVPVRFETDRLDINLSNFHAGQIPDIDIIEVRP